MSDALSKMFPALGSTTGQFAEAAVFFVALVIAGFVLDTILYRVVRARSEKRHWRPGMELARGLHGLPTAIAAIVGASVGLNRLDLQPNTVTLVRTLVEVASIVALTIFAARIAGRVIRAYTERDDAKLPSSTIFVNLTRAFVWVIGSLSVLAALGVSITPLLTALGVGGLAIGLALQSTLENVFSGIQVLMSRQIEPGDFIQLESGEQGWVNDVTWRNTTIKLFTNDLIIVPNSTIAKSRIVNFTTMDEQHVVWLNVGVAYDSDLEHVEEVTLDVARTMQREFESAVTDYEPLFRFTEFGDDGIGVTVSIRAESVADRWVLRHEFIKRATRPLRRRGNHDPVPAAHGAHRGHVLSTDSSHSAAGSESIVIPHPVPHRLVRSRYSRVRINTDESRRPGIATTSAPV